MDNNTQNEIEQLLRDNPDLEFKVTSEELARLSESDRQQMLSDIKWLLEEPNELGT